ncbi:serine/threonine protein kinase [Gemmata sp. JC673]|uniref:Serine/threonine protein kinase n=1 Tax=Gemmata algarum TaxID=2975278 RepID=A0ABU5EX16_9BACT|nr:serine/threonine-protein kinase [Gemmata algarum]MDY3559818.1 serine/threonine protein kinase [Gemmata algarum]
MPDPNEPSLIVDPRLGSLLVSSPDHLSGAAGPVPCGGAAAPAFRPPAAAGEVGTLGHYRIVRELGRGGMGAVYLAVDTRLDRPLALKVMLPAFAADGEAKERFLREAKAAARISHDHVVTVFEADERDGIAYIAMQLLQGYPLDAFVQKKGSPSLRHAVRVAWEAALGLAAAHKLGIVHRDVKPANLWLEAPRGRVKLLDFGLAWAADADTELTKSGAVLGTPAFMAPEQALGEKVDHRADLFSLGAVLYSLVTGQLPFPGVGVGAVLTALTTAEPKPVRALNPNVPKPLAELIHQLLTKDPAGRPQTAAAVANRLHEIAEQSANLFEAVSAGAPGLLIDPADPWAPRAAPGDAEPGGAGGLRSMPLVVVAPAAPEGVREQDRPTEPGPLHTVLSSGIVWDERPAARGRKGEAEGPDRRRRKRPREDDNEDGFEPESSGRPRRKRLQWADHERGAERRPRPLQEREPKGSIGAAPILIGVGTAALIALVAGVALVVANGKSSVTPPGPPETANGSAIPHNIWPGLGGPVAPAAPGAKPSSVPVPVPPAIVPRGPEPTILGSIPHDPKFKTVGPPGAVLIGLVARFEKYGPTDIVRAVRPIYRVNGRDALGTQFGADLSGAVVMKARDGYAVGGITGKAGPWCNGFSLTYMRVKPDGSLDTGDSYEGGWGGSDPPGGAIRVVSDGRPAVGVVGKIAGPNATALGLLFKGQEGWNPEAGGSVPPRPPAKETIVGNASDPLFRDEAPPGGLLVGLDVWYGTFTTYDVIDGVRPIFRTAGRETLGQLHGRETARGVRVLAKPDYAVGALDVKAGLGLDSVTVTFMKVRGGGLDPADAYASARLGGPGGGSHPLLGGDGTPVTGIIGRKNGAKPSGLGLAFSTTK